MKLALVTPWYGRELIGGAERLAWELAHALVRSGAEVDVLTTCCRSFLDDWASNYHRSGVTRDGSGVVLHRFPVDTRDRVAFNRANTVLTTMPPVGLHGDRAVLDQRRRAPSSMTTSTAARCSRTFPRTARRTMRCSSCRISTARRSPACRWLPSAPS